MIQEVKKTTRLLTLRQASELLGVHPNTLRLWDKAGDLVAIRIGSGQHRRYRLIDIKEYIKRSRSIKKS